MKDNILLSKIVANSSITCWAQAYSTLNLYVVISLEKESSEESIASYGKIILEKIQREFFALEEKNLKNVKSAVTKTVEGINADTSYSIVLATIINNTLYIVTAGEGAVALKRKGKIGIVAQGSKMQILSFSGNLENSDILIIETHGFFKKIPHARLSELTDNLRTLEISENLAPIIHGGSIGNEAAIVLEYQKTTSFETRQDSLESESFQKTSPEVQLRKIAFPKISFPKINIQSLEKIFRLAVFKRKTVIVTAIVVLSLLFIVGIAFERTKQEQKKNAVFLESVLSPAQNKYNDGVALLNVNKNLAEDNLQSAKQLLEASKAKFKEGSVESQKIEGLLLQINEKLNGIRTTSVKDQKLVFDVKSSSKIKQIEQINIKGGDLSIIDSNANLIIASKDDGKIGKEIALDAENSKKITGDDNYIFVLTDSTVHRIDRQNKTDKKIIDLTGNSGYGGMDTFLGNVYVLNNKTVEKYTDPNFKQSSYLINEVSLDNPVSLSIDGSVWILEASGKIRKFTKGAEETFSIMGLTKKIGKNSIIYTDIDFGSIYVLDKDNQAIISIDKKGQYQNQWDLRSMGKINSFCVDEKNKKIFVSTTTQVFSFSF
ncbi:MAG: hypothetical protein A2857_01040 [Candidatus Levybacteria bacterium RIFCSPHIGHO2_01_FULL_36_15]|nr:MAG: hypothetical protein A2857_01040 [Candidatus Levybacteria bacterium RIFCSPHIGHO2_01_FULL_36_15]OGH38621.1 MAG: hypothetical protein A2905_04390 [Candidatus Levybacteria bacterium RIFCSPLOWO2_01_FULL_36_10]